MASAYARPIRSRYFTQARWLLLASTKSNMYVSQDLSEYDLVPRAGQRAQIVQRGALRDIWLKQK